jgi:hypothetical protein
MKIEIGNTMKIPADEKIHPESGHFGTCVWISENGEIVAVQCGRLHDGKKNTVFLVKIDSKK